MEVNRQDKGGIGSERYCETSSRRVAYSTCIFLEVVASRRQHRMASPQQMGGDMRTLCCSHRHRARKVFHQIRGAAVLALT